MHFAVSLNNTFLQSGDTFFANAAETIVALILIDLLMLLLLVTTSWHSGNHITESTESSHKVLQMSEKVVVKFGLAAADLMLCRVVTKKRPVLESGILFQKTRREEYQQCQEDPKRLGPHKRLLQHKWANVYKSKCTRLFQKQTIPKGLLIDQIQTKEVWGLY